MTEVPFIHLRLHTEYSLKDSVIRIEDLFKKASTMGIPALGISDHCNLFATIKFYKTALSYGIKPLIGLDFLVTDPLVKTPSLLTLFCQNQEGFKALCELTSRAYLEGQTNGQAKILSTWLTPQNCQHFIALQNYHSELQSLLEKNSPTLEEYLKKFNACFPKRWYIELSRTGKIEEQNYERLVLPLAEKFLIPLVATNDVRFIDPEDFEAHEARVAIHDGAILSDPKRSRKYTEQQYLRSNEEMHVLFKDLPSALKNSVEIAKRCNFILPLGNIFLPKYSTGGISTETYLTQKSREALENQFKKMDLHTHTKEDYYERLETELKVINQMGFAGYFLIVADFIEWSKKNDIPVGPGRGSGAGSLVAYVLGITGLDPLTYDLLFERFLNPERISMPDFDIDFCMDGRDRVIEYVAQKYGRENVSQIITYGSMAAKAVVRDVGRVLAYPYGFVDKIAKLIPLELGITLSKAIEQETELKRRYAHEEDVKTLLDLALKLEGLVRNAGKHAGGVVIAPSKLTDFVPLFCEEKGENAISQFDKDDVETIGLVKFDFLGLRTLTIIDWAVKNINAHLDKDKSPLNISKIPLNDTATYQLLKNGYTTAIFQLESRGMKDLIKRLKPDCFEDIIALVALFRPGPLQSGMVDNFMQRKHGQAKIEYFHPNLEPILKPTYGIILYQEQVMQIAQVLAGYTLGAADLLRRAMGKKKAEEMAEQRTIFVEGAKQRGIDVNIANLIFDLMEKFAGYGFNKSHSAAYAVLSYQTAWLKTHYPAEFMAAVLSSDMDNTDKIVNFIYECKEMNLNIIAPNINTCEFRFTVENDPNLENNKNILYGLGAIKGTGEAALSGIIEERKRHGPYKDLFDFSERNDLRKLNKRVFEALIKSGALDCFGRNRATLWATMQKACQHADQKTASIERGQSDLFGLHIHEEEKDHHYVTHHEWTLTQKLQSEKETLGWYLSGHPLTTYHEEILQLKASKIKALSPAPDKIVRVLAQCIQMRIILTKRKDQMGILTLEDETGILDCTLFSEELEKYRAFLQEGEILLVEGTIDHDQFTQGIRMSVKKIIPLSEARECYGKALILKTSSDIGQKLLNETTKQLLQKYPGNFPIVIRYHNQQAYMDCSLGSRWRIKPTDELLQHLQELFTPENVQILY